METTKTKEHIDGLSIFFIEIYGLFTLALIVSCLASWLTVKYYNGFNNLIDKNPLLPLLAIIGVGVYGFLSMYEVNMLKNNYLKYHDSVRRGWIVSVAALDLFYAFVNIFLNILSILDPDAENDD